VKAHLLFDDRDFGFTAPLPAGHEDLVKDLELDTLLQAMADGDKFLYEVSEKVLLAPVADPGAIRYRQRILADCLARPAVIREVYALATAALTDKSHYWGLYGAHYQTPSSNLSGAISHLESYTVRLRQLRKVADDHAGEFRSDGLTTLFATLRNQLDDDYFAEVARHLKQLRFRDGVALRAELAPDNTGVNFMLCAPTGAARQVWRDWLHVGARSSYGFSLAPRDEAGGRILDDLTSRGVNLVANAAAQSADNIGGYFRMLRAEVGFYVGCLNLHDRLAAKGVPLAVPDPADRTAQPFSCADLRDVALELQSPGTVVGNDVPADGKTLVIITGANSGGKSTFLRSVGQAQLMMQCGLFTTAARYAAAVATGIFTHFIRAEDPSMTSGRLDDELRRMAAIAGRLGPRSLVLFNESFVGTNEREGSEIGYQVVSALLDAQVKVLFVSHRYDFAERFRRQRADSTLFLRAERQPDGQRNYHLAVKDPLPASFGEDLYYRLGGW
jgi:DNA mismatch repair ATPase MutS